MAAEALDLGHEGVCRWLVCERLTDDREGACGRLQLVFAQVRDLQCDPNLLVRIPRASPFAEVDTDQVLPQRVDIGDSLQRSQGDVVRLFVVGAPVPFEGAPWLLQHVFGGLGHREHQLSPCFGLLGQPKLFLFDGD